MKYHKKRLYKSKESKKKKNGKCAIGEKQNENCYMWDDDLPFGCRGCQNHNNGGKLSIISVQL